MNLNQCSTANLRLMLKHGRISEREFLDEIEQRENEQADIRAHEREMFSNREHPNRLAHMFPGDK